ncbi:MAG: hypothetical protein M1825_000564 [Sarcosagium campestre]|nr:MAG: hypothetical protein M1825_000564 [Sarcosagium campestre]
MASIFKQIPFLRPNAPRLPGQLFTCNSCLRTGGQSSKWIGRSPVLNVRRNASSNFNFAQADITRAPSKSEAQSLLSRFFPQQTQQKSTKRYFAETNDKIVGYWLLGSAASVFGIVVFGGLTRLTESGYFPTNTRSFEWRPVTGSLPPFSASDWDAEFDRYKASPEFKLLNPHMELSEFKYIYWMEWTHRLWGRFVGLSFVLPAAYFIARRRVSAPMAARITGIAALIGSQGALGWWMVKSGLKDDLFAPGSHPRVSQYRLTAHLGTAFLCYTAMLWNGLSILRENRLVRDVQAREQLAQLRNPVFAPLRRYVGVLAGLVFLTAMSGGLVAGLDAGMIYNEFPYMGEGLTPPKSELFSNFYSRHADGSDIWWRNMLENPSTVQLDHRILATTTFTAVMGLWAYSRYSPTLKTLLPSAARRGIRGVVHLVSLQVILGISTLLYLVPISLASAHQANSLALLTGVIVLGSRVWVPRRLINIAAKAQAGGLQAKPLHSTMAHRPLKGLLQH